MATVSYALASSQDAPLLTQLALDSNATYAYRAVSDEVARAILGVKQECFDVGVVMLMKLDDQLIGFFGLCQRKTAQGEHVNELSHLFLVPQFIGQGYGTRLFQQAMATAKSRFGWNAIEWESDPNAAGFYRKMGATQIGDNLCPLHPAMRAPVFAYNLADRHRLFQYSHLEAFDKLVYDGSMSIADLRAYGNFGLGCFNRLDGELIAFDDQFFHATADGRVQPADERALVSCVYMQRFSPLFSLAERRLIRYKDLLDVVQGACNPVGQPFFAIRLKGLFSVINVRSIPLQSKPYPSIPEIVEKQTLFEYRDVAATMVGFFFPSYVQGLTFQGFHLHFITSDRRHGGHVLDFEARELEIEIDPIESYHVVLPDYAKVRQPHA